MILQDVRSFENFIDGKLFWIPYFTIFNGLMMAILSLLGFLATNKQDYKLLVTVRKFEW